MRILIDAEHLTCEESEDDKVMNLECTIENLLSREKVFIIMMKPMIGSILQMNYCLEQRFFLRILWINNAKNAN